MSKRLTCERCGKRIRQWVQLIRDMDLQDFSPEGRPADIDPDCCEECGETIIAEMQETDMTEISNVTLEFLRDQYRSHVQCLLDDPVAVVETPAELAEWVTKLEQIGEEIGLDFWETARSESNDYERARLKTLLKEAGR